MRLNPLCRICRWLVVLSTFVVQSDILSHINSSYFGVLWFLISTLFSFLLISVVYYLKTARFLLISILGVSVVCDTGAVITYLNGGGAFYSVYPLVTSLLYYICLSLVVSRILWIAYENKKTIGSYFEILNKGE